MKELRIALVILLVGILAVLFGIPHFNGHREPALMNTCINNLRVIDGFKQEWALDHHKGDADMPTWTDLSPYLSRYGTHTNILKCPLGGVYTLGAVSNKPTCSIPGHVLP